MADYFRKTKSLYSSTTNSFSSGEAETITPSSVAGLPTDTEIVLTFDRTVAGKLERILGTISGSNFVISSGGRGYDGTSDTSHTSPTVEYIPNAADINAMVTGIRINHTQAGLHDFNGTEVILDADADTTITADTDDQIDIKIANADDFKFTANTFTALSGSTIATNTIAETTAASGVTIDGVLLKDGAATLTADLQLAATGNIQANGADPKRGLYIPASALFPATTTGCAALAQGETTTNKINYKYLAFDASTEEYAWFHMPTPDYWDLGTITVKFHWTAASSSGDVIWGAAGLCRSDDDALDTALGSAVTVTDTLTATGDEHTTSATSAITIGGTPAKGDKLYLRVYRDADAGGDTLAADAHLTGITIKFSTGQYDDQ